MDNIIETQSGFCLIDWELAGKNAEMVFWSGPSLPPDVNLRHRPYVFTDDLWQLGKTLARITTPRGSLKVYVDALMDGSFPTATAALSDLWKL